MIRPAEPSDAETIAAIYNHYIANTTITFEVEPVAAQDIAGRIKEIGSANLPWLVAEEEGAIVGYAYATKWKGRSAYRHSVECSVYLAPASLSKGWGTRLYEALFAVLREKSIHVVIGGVALPNPASVALHEKLGMKKVGHFSEVGFKFDRWVDVGYWQMAL
ncbi:arsinothricin resistance N-acetyltransferase ArsN1 family B [Pseudogulbenkiania subflava]|uniref:arsinothricin resistance N-acetyltransferase ArsN1 family B n=1 Tax=Pseudogulbenkiania subflava TaxID=451637 RepID=UPI000A14C231|nr:arsinothricin resistance N-acetyltransferase ArsN1 family B [Pseudogulbenkiania subflava]